MVQRALLVLLLAGCIGEPDVDNALANWCASSLGRECTKTVECCPSFACAAGGCRPIVAGHCLFEADAGMQQASGEGCGCTADCAQGTCTASKCQ